MKLNTGTTEYGQTEIHTIYTSIHLLWSLYSFSLNITVAMLKSVDITVVVLKSVDITVAVLKSVDITVAVLKTVCEWQ